MTNDITDDGITVLGVDILPSEVPRESSEHFGYAVTRVIEELVQAKTQQHQHYKGIDPSFVSVGLVRYCNFCCVSVLAVTSLIVHLLFLLLRETHS